MPFAQPLFAQQTTAGGTVKGIVSDTGGVALSEAAVHLTNPATNATFSTTSASDGRYSIPDVPPGTYTLSSTMRGMRSFQRAGLAVTAGQTVQADIRIDDIAANTLGEDRVFYADLYNPPDVPPGLPLGWPMESQTFPACGVPLCKVRGPRSLSHGRLR